MSDRLDPYTLRAIIGRAADTAATILSMSQKFHASDGMREYARVRADALVEFSQGLAKLLKEAEAPPETLRGGPVPLNNNQLQAAKEWAADDRLWTTQETVEFNLRTFARTILAKAEAPPETGHAQRWEPRTLGERLSYEQGHKDAREQAEAEVATLRALTEQVREWRAEAEAAGDRARAEAALRREVEAERNASLATATEAAGTVARLTAERDTLDCTRREGGDTRHCPLDRKCLRCRLEQAEAERDAARRMLTERCDFAVTEAKQARAQVWAEAIAVVGQERERFTKGSDLSTVYAQYSVRDSFDSVLAALRAAQERQG